MEKEDGLANQRRIMREIARGRHNAKSIGPGWNYVFFHDLVADAVLFKQIGEDLEKYTVDYTITEAPVIQQLDDMFTVQQGMESTLTHLDTFPGSTEEMLTCSPLALVGYAQHGKSIIAVYEDVCLEDVAQTHFDNYLNHQVVMMSDMFNKQFTAADVAAALYKKQKRAN